MVKFTMESIHSVMKDRDRIRNISVIAHVDHGKTTLSDSLVARAGIIPEKMQGDVRFMSARKDEITRGITIKSSGVSLYFEHGADKSPHLINLIDSPGHVDFSSEVTAALRVTDGALVVVDAVEGVCVQTETVLRQAVAEKIVPILFINKFDRFLMELKSDPEDVYDAFRRSIESANSIVGAYQEVVEGYQAIELDPIKGNVGFGSGYQGWGFTLEAFARLYEAKLGIPADKLVGKLWGENYYDPSLKKWTTSNKDADGKTLKRGFCEFIIEPIQKIFSAALQNEKDKLKQLITRLDIQVTATELENLTGKDLVKLVMRRFIGADECILNMVVTHLPSPVVAQRYRFAHLYKGPLDDEVATAIKNCDPEGPLMMYVSKMIPSDGGRFIAFGRVFSGTVRPNQRVRILGPNYEKGKSDDLFIKPIQNTVVMMGRKVESIEDCPCGNIIGVTGIDHFLVKTGSLTTSEEAHAMAAMKFSVSPVVRVTINAKYPADLPRLLEGLKRLAKTDPAIQVYTEDTGENILATVGELQLEICLNDLRDYAQCDFVTSNPIVSYRETVVEKSQVCLAKSPNKHNRIYMTAEPLGQQLTEEMENKTITTGMEIPQRIEKFGAHGWTPQEVRNIWCFGPSASGNPSNVLVNSTTGVQYLNEIREYIVSAFQWTTNQGILCEEPMRGVKFVLNDVTAIADAVHRGGGQIIPASRRCMFASELSAQPRLVEPYYLADITCPELSIGGVHSALGRRRGTIIEEHMASRGLYNIKAYLPVSESFGFNSFLAVETSGRAFLQMTFDHYETIDSDPLLPSSKGRDIVKTIRIRKGLKEEIPVLSDYLDKL